MKDLILVESPTKARTLTRFLKGKYEIEASMGHIRDLPKGKLGVDIENSFEPQYVTPRDKMKTLKALKEKAKGAKNILLATDPDREGEAISYHLYEQLKSEAKKATFKRIVFHEITQGAIEEALKQPREIDNNLVSAQVARRVLDRIVGYKLSPLLWKKIKRQLSAGRVQSIALRLIVEREREIEKFITEEYFRLFALLAKKDRGNQPKADRPLGEKEFELVQINDEKIEKSEKLVLYDGEYKFTKTILDKNRAEEVALDIKPKEFIVTNVAKKESKRSPNPPFITSSLQQEAARRLFYPSRKTMSMAQKLYEEGFITYHRTDSYNVSKEFTSQAIAYVKSTFGEKYVQPRVFQTKSKVAQEAHEAIRPTKVGDIKELKQQVAQVLGNDAAKVYELIYKRSLATQMADARFEATKVQVSADQYLFETSGSVLLFDGFLKLWFYEENDNILEDYVIGEHLTFIDSNVTNHTTTPPPRYNEASLIGALERHGIGRPSTYATIVSTIQDRGYVEKQENRFTPIEIGKIVNDFLVKNFKHIDDIPFTATMEDELDEIANGTRAWVPMMKDFYIPFEKELEKAENEEKIEIKQETTGRTCPECKEGELLIRRSRFGKFIACSKYPDCKYTENFADESITVVCPKDGGKISMKRTKKGRSFYGCVNYPKCDFAVWNKNQLLKEAKPAPPAA